MSILFPTGELRSNKEDNSHTWVISHYNDFAGFDVVTSPAFLISGDNEKKFEFHMEGTGSKCLNLRCVQQNTERLPCKYSIAVVKDSEIMEIRMGHCTFSKDRTEKEIFKFDVSDLAEYLSISRGQFSTIHSLTFRCELTDSTIDQKPLNYNINRMSEPKLQFNSLFLDKKFSDVVLRTSSKEEIPAHRIVLAAASPVFNAMFSHEMLESKTQSVDMIDVDHDAAVEMLRHIYTGNIESGVYSLTAEVLSAADKYQLEELKYECEKRMVSDLSTENAMEILNTADAHCAKYLTEGVINFLTRQMNGDMNIEEKSNMLLGKVASK
ncbi:hypothetical protein TKK_0007072 [Trichogramma kaykai]